MQLQRTFLLLLVYCFLFPCNGKTQDHTSLKALQALLKNTSEENTRVLLLSAITDSLHKEDLQLAEKYAQEAFDLLPKVSEDSIKLKALFSLQTVHLAQKKYANCKVLLDSALVIAQEMIEKKFLWQTHFTIGELYFLQRKPLIASNHFHQALGLETAQITLSEKVKLNNRLGIVYRDLGEMEKAKIIFTKNVAQSRSLNQPELIAKTLYSLGEFHRRRRENEIAKKHLLEALELWQKTANHKGVFNIYTALGIMNKNQANYDQALKYYDLAMPYVQDQGDEASLHSSRGILYKNLGNYDKALAEYAKANKIYTILKDSFRLQMVSVNKGIVHKRRGEFDLALKHFHAELEYREKNNDVFRTNGCYRRLCDVYLELKNYDLALEYAQKALVLSTKIEDNGGLVNAHAYLGQTYHAKKQLAKAEDEFRTALQLSKEIGAKLSEAINMQNLGEVLWAQERFQEALDYQFEAFQKAKILDSKLLIASLTGMIAKHLIELKHQEEKEFALNFKNWTKFDLDQNLEEALSLAEETDDFQNQQLIYNVLSEFYQYKKDFQRAYDFKAKYAAIKDSVFTQEKTTALAEMQTKFQTERTEKENELLKTQNELIHLQSRNYLIASSLLLALLIVGGIFYWQLGRVKNQLQFQNKTIESQNLELLSLNKTKDRFFGIIAHDLRSPILAFQGIGKQINHYLRKDDKEKLTALGQTINHTATKLNRLLDNLLNWALLQTGRIPYHPQEVNVSELIEELEELFLPVAQTKNITISTKVNPQLRIYADEQALDTTLRNLLSNAVKFTREAGKISIQAHQENEQIIFLVEDTGIGIPKEMLSNLFGLQAKSLKGTSGEKGTGLGLLLCKELTTLNKGNITVKSKLNEGTRFQLSFPVASKKVHHLCDDALVATLKPKKV